MAFQNLNPAAAPTGPAPAGMRWDPVLGKYVPIGTGFQGGAGVNPDAAEAAGIGGTVIGDAGSGIKNAAVDAGGAIKDAAGDVPWGDVAHAAINPIDYGLSKVGLGFTDGLKRYPGGAAVAGVIDKAQTGLNDLGKTAAPAPPAPGTAGALAGTAGATSAGAAPAWDDATTRAKAQADAREAAYSGAVPRTAPQAANVNVGPAAQAGPVTVARARDVVAPDVQRAQVAGVAPIEAAGVQRAVVAPTANITGTNIGRTEDQQTRSQQELSIQALQDAAAGRVPSAAERQAELLTDRAIKQQFALGTALQGTNAGSALRAATKGGAEAQLNIAADAYAQRAGEQAGARRDLASTLGAVRGQDIGVNTEQAKLTQEANVRNQQTELSTKLAQGDIDQKTYALASTNLQNARTSNQQSELQRALKQGEIDKDTFVERSRLLAEAEKANQTADVNTNIAQGNISANIATSNSAELNKVAIAQAGLDKDVNVANSMRAIDQMHLDDTRSAELGRAAIESEKVFQAAITGKDDSGAKAAHIAAVQRSLDQAQQGLANAKTAAERQFWAGIIGAGLGTLGSLGAAVIGSGGKTGGVTPGTVTTSTGGNETIPSWGDSGFTG